MTESLEDSPNILDTRSRRGAGVRRLNRVPLVVAAIMGVLLAGAVTYTYQTRLAEMRRRAAEAVPRPEPANVSDLFKDAPSSGLIDASRREEPAKPNLPAERLAPITEKATPEDEAWQHYRKWQEDLAALRDQRLRQAISAATRIEGPRQAARPASPVVGTAQAGTTANGPTSTLLSGEAVRQQRLSGGENGEADLNRATEKQAFLSDRPPQNRADAYLPGGREAPLSPYDIKAGTVIPAIMIGGVSSDLPGQIIGQVTENIYDTATGRYVLIPQGAKLIGTYDNAVTTGQQRVLVAWTRIILPDASSIDLGKMPGADAGGFAGFHDRVDDHFWAMFGSALLMSVFSAGVQISQGGQSSDGGLTAQQSIAAGLGQQLGQLGQEIARRNTRIQPTLEIRPGYQFTVMVTKDIALRPWRERPRQADE
jgi:type IV secretion system protein TrbI